MSTLNVAYDRSLERVPMKRRNLIQTTCLRSRLLSLVSAFSLLLLGAAEAQESNVKDLPKPWIGLVSDIVDGDGIYVVGSEYQIRLLGVDAPEKGSDGFHEATQTLAALVDGKLVRVDPQYWQPATPRYKKRLVARVWIGSIEVNRRVIDQGPAREFCKYSKGIYGRC